MSIVEILMQQLDGDAVDRIGAQLGADRGATSNAITAALPMLLEGLSRNSSGGGLDALSGALERDHDGSVLDDLSGYLDRGPGKDGNGILGHVFGGSKPQVEQALGGMSGLDSGSAGKLLAMLAPLVMGALGRQRREGNLDSGGLGDLLGSEHSRAKAANPDIISTFGKMLDADGDGSFTDDLASMGKGILGSLLK